MDLTGKKVGWIRIERRLGSGGMGAVYQGFHEKLKRAVAVKTILKEPRLKEITRARFLREARLLSSLDHPNICRIYDYIEDEDFDLIVLELIEGESLKEVMKRPLSRQRAFQIARPLAAAVAAAHAKGIVHRDIKPDNVMFTPDGVLKVLDFGLSRTEAGERLSQPPASDAAVTLDEDLTAFHIQTQHGILMGTLNYMSPEQARGETATSASDMYALGLLLQELFTGAPALERGLAFGKTLQLVAGGETQPVKGLPEPLTRLIERLKNPVPQARPAAVDVMERLDFIAAAPLRRRKRLVTWAVGAALLIFALVMAWQTRQVRKAVARANSAAHAAGEAAASASEVSDFLLSLFEDLDPATRDEPVSARHMLAEGARRVNGMTREPLSKARLMQTMAGIYQKLGDAEAALPLVEEALAIRRAQLGPDHLETADSQSLAARIYKDLDRYDAALDMAGAALAARERLLGRNHPSIARELLVVAGVHALKNDYAQALLPARRALEIREAHLPADDPALGEALSVYGAMLDYSGDNAEAEKVLRRAVAILEKGPDALLLVDALNNLGKVYSQEFQFDACLEMYQRALELNLERVGHDNPVTGDLYNNIAILYVNMDQDDQAVAYYLRALEIYRRVYGETHSNVAKALGNLAHSYYDQHDYPRALDAARRAYEIQKASTGDVGGANAYQQLVLAKVLVAMGRYDEARRHYREALAVTRRYRGANAELIAVNAQDLAGALRGAARKSDAEELYRAALDLWSGMAVPDVEGRLYTMEALVGLYTEDGRSAEAEAMARRLEDLRRATEDDKTGI